MAKETSQDIAVLFSAFDKKDRVYNELSEFERYNEIKKSWCALVLLSESKVNRHYLLSQSNENSVDVDEFVL